MNEAVSVSMVGLENLTRVTFLLYDCYKCHLSKDSPNAGECAALVSDSSSVALVHSLSLSLICCSAYGQATFVVLG